MLGIGLWELAAILAVAIVVLGPERLSSLAKKAGSVTGKAKRKLGEIRRELDLDEDPEGAGDGD